MIIFMLGLLTMVISCARIALDVVEVDSYTTCELPSSFKSSAGLTSHLDTVENAEIAIQILVVTLPALRPLFGVIQDTAKLSYGKFLTQLSTLISSSRNTGSNRHSQRHPRKLYGTDGSTVILHENELVSREVIIAGASQVPDLESGAQVSIELFSR